MAGGVGADELPGRSGDRAFAVVTCERRIVVLPLVAEDLAEAFENGIALRAPFKKEVPVEMRDLVPEVADERAVVLAEHLALALALKIFRLSDIDGDDTVIIPGEHRRGGRGRRKSKASPCSASICLFTGIIPRRAKA